MNKKIEISEPYEELVNFKAKLMFLNSAKNAIDEKIMSGDVELSDEENRGVFLMNWDLEREVETILSKLEKLL
jgi:hypothetical protein